MSFSRSALRDRKTNRPCKRVLAQLVLHQCRQTIMTFAEVHRLRRHHDPYPVRWKDHAEAENARATAAIRAADAPSSRRIVTAPTMISGRLTSLIGGSAAGVSITIAANSTASSGAGSTQLALPRHRSPRRQVVRLQAIAIRNLFHHRARSQALRNDPGLQIVRPLAMNLTAGPPSCENLQCSLHGETPFALPWEVDHRSSGTWQRGGRTPVTRMACSGISGSELGFRSRRGIKQPTPRTGARRLPTVCME